MESAFPLLGIYPREMKANVSKKARTGMSVAALSVTAPTLRRGRVAINGRPDQLRYIRTVK